MDKVNEKFPATKFIAIGLHYWGKGNTLEEAVKNCKKEGCSTKQKDMFIYKTNEKAYVDDMGSLVYQTKIEIQIPNRETK